MKADRHVEAQINELLDQFSDAFAHHDSSKVLSLFADEDVTFIGSEIIEEAFDKRELEHLLTRIFSRPATYTWEWNRRLVSCIDSVAWVMADAIIYADYGDGKTENGPYRVSAVFRQKDGEWKWVQFHGSEPMEVDE